VGLRRAGEGWDVTLHGPRGEETVRAKVVIGADGVESMVGRGAGLDTRVPSRDMESCAQYVVSNIAFDPDALYLHFGETIAPHGYAWIFPKGVGVANVGLGVIALKAQGRTARDYLDAYVARRYPEGAISGSTVGGVIVGTTLKRTVTDGLMLVGDAAHQVNPLSGGGIINAMKAGRIAGRHAAEAIRAGDTSARRLEACHAEWLALLGEDHRLYYRIKETLNTFDDAFFNALARTVGGIPADKRRVVLGAKLIDWERGPLGDPEFVLLIDNDQPEFAKTHVFLDQCLCADHQVDLARFHFQKGGIDHEFAVDAPHPHGAHGPLERDAGDGQRPGGGVDGQHVGLVHAVSGEHVDDDLDLVHEVIGKERPQGPVGEAARERFTVTGPSLAFNESAGKFSRGI
jgi:hypothetical protein